MPTINIFSNKTTNIILGLLSCALLGSLYPVIKLGYAAFKIPSGDIPSIILFAGLRFLISGIILIALSYIKKTPNMPQKHNIKYIILDALFTIILHYSFTYIALALGEGSKSAIIKQVGYLFLSCFAFLFDKKDTWSFKKTLAGIIGFSGIIATNSDSNGFTFAIGDILLIASSFCSIFGSAVEKKAVKTMSSTSLVAYSELFGGIFLCTIALLLGGRISHIDVNAIMVFGYICFASIGGYVIWNILLKYNSLSKLAIIRFSIPLFAVLLSGLILQENIFKISYLIALLLIFTAILIANIKPKEKKL